jgi:tRNA (cmo5U34)-methyltransferase
MLLQEVSPIKTIAKVFPAVMRQKSRREKITAFDFRYGGTVQMNRKDRLFDSEISTPGDFVFDDRVVQVFPDMIKRSVPGYSLVVPMIGLLARRYAQADSNLYDLGCSLGAVTLAMRDAVQVVGGRIIAVDNSGDMIRQLKKTLQSANGSAALQVHPRHQDILDTRIENASVVVLGFTLQFVEPSSRLGLLKNIAAGLNPGGIMVLSEKIRFEDALEQDLQTAWHHDFKRAQGYSDLEIARKRDALENVMKPDCLQEHMDRMLEAGFGRVYQWFQGFNFVSMVAFK